MIYISKRKYHLIQEKDFNLVKVLVENGMPTSEINMVTHRSAGVISLIRAAANYADYKKLRQIFSEKYKKTNGEHKKEPKKTDPIHEYEARFETKLLNRFDTVITLLTKLVNNKLNLN